MSSHTDWLTASATRVPDREALRVGGESWTYRELDRVVWNVARGLSASGLQAGDRVATLLPNGLVAALLPHALLRLGATLVPLNIRLAPSEIEWQLAHARPRFVVSDRTVAAGDARLVSAEEILRFKTASREPRAESRVPEAESPLAIIYTSGTTGRPKGAMLTVGNFHASALASAQVLGVRDDDRWLAVLPLFHVGGLSILFRSAIQGTCAVVHERFDPADVNRAIDREGITMVSVVAVMWERLLDDRGDRPFPPTFRCALLGGGPAAPALLERCERLGVPVAQTYGLTEATSQVATLPPAGPVRRPGAAGRALPGIEIRVQADSGEGEILVRGAVVMKGYFDDPAATDAALRDGWLHTGDIGRMDEEGYLYVLDRRDDLIVSGGENVYPAEVEAALAEHPFVAEAAVIGVPDETWGQRVVAIVRFRDPAPPPDELGLRELCRRRLAGYKVPREITFVTEPLPRTASGKLQRSRLRALE